MEERSAIYFITPIWVLRTYDIDFQSIINSIYVKKENIPSIYYTAFSLYSHNYINSIDFPKNRMELIFYPNLTLVPIEENGIFSIQEIDYICDIGKYFPYISIDLFASIIVSLQTNTHFLFPNADIGEYISFVLNFIQPETTNLLPQNYENWIHYLKNSFNINKSWYFDIQTRMLQWCLMPSYKLYHLFNVAKIDIKNLIEGKNTFLKNNLLSVIRICVFISKNTNYNFSSIFDISYNISIENDYERRIETIIQLIELLIYNSYDIPSYIWDIIYDCKNKEKYHMLKLCLIYHIKKFNIDEWVNIVSVVYKDVPTNEYIKIVLSILEDEKEFISFYLLQHTMTGIESRYWYNILYLCIQKRNANSFFIDQQENQNFEEILFCI